MSETALLWVLGIVVTAVIGLAVGLVSHIKEDTRAHERIATLEERTNVQGDEIRSLRDIRHEIIEHCTHALAEWYQKVVEMIAKLK